jgi:prevent-host-death family protein
MRSLYKVRSFLNIMKVIPLSEAKTHLSHYGRLCHDEPIIVTVNGVPSFQLVPLEEDDDLIDRLLEYNPKFREQLASRLRDRTVSTRAAREKL